MRFPAKITSSCIWVAIPIDSVILHWYACGADGRGSDNHIFLGGVYMRKLAPARVSYRDDFLISYRVYMTTGSFHISLFEGTFHVDKINV